MDKTNPSNHYKILFETKKKNLILNIVAIKYKFIVIRVVPSALLTVCPLSYFKTSLDTVYISLPNTLIIYIY